jgi:CHAD domain-containing protein
MSNPATRELRAAIVEALARLEQVPLSDHSVHEARKALKKARAALRLLRDALDDAAYRAENAALRDAGRHLAPRRDAKSALAALDALRERYPGKLPPLRVEKLMGALDAKPESTTSSRALPRQPTQLLKRCLERADQPDFTRIGARPLERGLRRIYRKGRKAFAEAQSSGTTEALHEWRKQVKYLANALEALYAPKRGKTGKIARRTKKFIRTKKLTRSAEKLAGRLGDEHDLAVLAQRTGATKRHQQGPAHARKQRPQRGLQPLIERRRTKLRKRAFALGGKLYRRKPGRFVERLPAPASLAATSSS